ncbi:translation machinery-associated protein 22-like isoform X2 [Durio zibethinus]|uniref:Translation machinery-associated protein 22 n=1 Tax=Durio zibethinus TaxID=66656 RepID=A0A6P5XNS1_DURZI|nr:translation machinery-associated protein 22-like isoform X2 [Durio zibethinus]
MAEKPQPVLVLYCQVCGLPAEYCEFGPEFDKCKPWLIQNAPDLYPDLLKANAKEADKVADQLQSAGISSVDAAAAAGGSSEAKQEEVKRLPGGKIKKKEKQEVVIEKVVRNKRKCITTVKGLELFGVKLSDASKKLGKKFATGASVVKGPNDKEQIDVQGDISYDVVEFITETWPNVILLSFSFPYNALCWGQMCLHFFVLYSMVGLAGQPGTSGFQPDPMGSVFFFFENQVLGQIKYY